jgi:hypothetical protein
VEYQVKIYLEPKFPYEFAYSYYSEGDTRFLEEEEVIDVLNYV